MVPGGEENLKENMPSDKQMVANRNMAATWSGILCLLPSLMPPGTEGTCKEAAFPDSKSSTKMAIGLQLIIPSPWGSVCNYTDLLPGGGVNTLILPLHPQQKGQAKKHLQAQEHGTVQPGIVMSIVINLYCVT